MNKLFAVTTSVKKVLKLLLATNLVISAYASTIVSSSASTFLSPTNENQSNEDKPNGKFTLKEALKYALTHSPTIDTNERQMHISELELKSSKSAFLPNLDFSATHGLQDSYLPAGKIDHSMNSSSIPWTSKISLELTETFYDNGASITKYSISNLNRQKSEIQYKKARDSLALELSSEFYNYSRLYRTLQIQTEQYELIKKQYELVKKSYEEGLKIQKDYIRFKTELSRAELDLVAARNNLNKSRVELLRIMSVPSVDSDKIDLEIDPGPVANISASLSKSTMKNMLSQIPGIPPAIESHYDYKLASIQNQIGMLEVDLVKRNYWPELSITSGSSYQSSDYLGKTAGFNRSFNNNQRLDWNVLFTVKYNIWDWGKRKRDVQIAEERRITQNNDQDKGLQSIRADINKLMLDLKQMKENYVLSEELLKLEESNTNSIKFDYQNGKVLYLDLITAMKSLADAKNKRIGAYFDLKSSVASYRYHQGTLYDSIISSQKSPSL